MRYKISCFLFYIYRICILWLCIQFASAILILQMYLKAYTLTTLPSKFKNFICLLDLKLGQHVASLFRVVINHSHECRKTSTSQQCGNDNHNNRNVDESRITMINNFKASTTEMCTNIYLMQFTKLSGIVLFAFLLPFNVMPNNIYSFHVIITQYQFDILMYMRSPQLITFVPNIISQIQFYFLQKLNFPCF